MKKGFKAVTAAALAISALTPVAAFAAENTVENGVYTTTNFYSLDAFKKLSGSAKAAALTSEGAVIVVAGKVYTGANVLSLNDTQLDASAVTVDAYNAANDNKLVSGKPIGGGTQTGDLNVEAVSATNGSTIEVKFSKAVKKDSVIESDGSVVDSLFDLVEDTSAANSTALAAQKATLSTDGKTLTIFLGSALEGNYIFKIAKDLILTADGKSALPAIEKKLIFKDTTRPAIVDVTNVSKYVFDINLTEAVASTGTVTATLADGTSVLSSASLVNNGKAIRVTLVNNNTNVNAGKDVKITIPSLTDHAGNVSVPLTQTLKVSNADVTAPKLVSAVATSARTIEITFDEAVVLDTTLTANNYNKFKFNGSAADTVITGIAAKAGDSTQTKYVVTLGADQTTAAYLDLLAGAATDLSGNDLEAASKLVTFNTDKTAPTIESNSVQKIGGVDYLVINFSEAVTLEAATALTFKSKDEFGIEQSATLAAGNIATDVTANGTSGKSFKIDLTNIAPSLKTGVEYTVEFAKGYFKDTFLNDLEKTSVKFVNNSSENAATTKLVATIGAEGVDADGRFINVSFDKAVDPTTATNVANYAVEGAKVKEVKLVTNSGLGATVKVYLTEDTVELTGNYDVTVQNIKGYNTTISAIDKTTKNILVTENVAAKVKAKSMTFATNTTISLTFDENVSVTTGTDYDLYIDGVKSNATVATAQGATNEIIVTVTGLDLSADIASTKKVVLKANGTFDIADDNSNIASTLDISLN